MRFFIECSRRDYEEDGDTPLSPTPDAVRRTEGGPPYYPVYWTVDIETLEDLMALVSKHGQPDAKGVTGLILRPTSVIADLPGIEIYNDWRE